GRAQQEEGTFGNDGATVLVQAIDLFVHGACARPAKDVTQLGLVGNQVGKGGGRHRFASQAYALTGTHGGCYGWQCSLPSTAVASSRANRWRAGTRRPRSGSSAPRTVCPRSGGRWAGSLR